MRNCVIWHEVAVDAPHMTDIWGERDDVQKASGRVEEACPRQPDSSQDLSFCCFMTRNTDFLLLGMPIAFDWSRLIHSIWLSALLRKSLQDLESQIEKSCWAVISCFQCSVESSTMRLLIALYCCKTLQLFTDLSLSLFVGLCQVSSKVSPTLHLVSV